jgi:hypothetical protein
MVQPPAPRRLHHPISIKVSARILHWPEVCACCLGPADSTLDASHTRVTGVRVVRENTRVWPIPYCQRCRDHIAAHVDASAARAQGGWFVVLALLLGTGAGVLAYHHEFGIALAAFAGAVVTALLGLWRLLVAAAHAARIRRLFQASCCRITPAIVYHGWAGSVHDFSFYSPDYAARFRQLNARKILP